MPQLTHQAYRLYNRLAVRRATAEMRGDALLAARLALLQDRAHDRYDHRKGKCDYCGKAFAEGERPEECPTFGFLCRECYLICECW